MKNNFTNETRGEFIFETTCWRCNRPNPELHHILGRESNSPLNAYPLCRVCHDKHIEMMGDQNIRNFLKETLLFLIKGGYKFTQEDYKFMEDNRRYYEKIIKELKP
jgi:hypothetical protein